MLTNAYLLAKIGADTAENEQHFAEILPIRRRLGPRPVPEEAQHEGDGEDVVRDHGPRLGNGPRRLVSSSSTVTGNENAFFGQNN